MRTLAPLALLLSSSLLLLLPQLACSTSTSGEGEGAEGEGDVVGEGEGEGEPACGPALVVGHQELDCGDVHFDVEATAACQAGGCGLIVDTHGATMTSDSEDEHTRMRALGTAAGYVVVQPSAPGVVPTWQTGTTTFPYDDDVWSFVQATAATFAIDRDRLHLMGFSQGSAMSLRLLCEHSDEIASVAPTANLDCFDAAGRAPAIERPILYTHGHHDKIVTWDSNAEPARTRIKAAYGISGDGEVIAQGTGFVAHRFENAAGTVFEFWEHDYGTALDIVFGGHCLAAPPDQPAPTFRCLDAEFDASLEVLRFFADHPRR